MNAPYRCKNCGADIVIAMPHLKTIDEQATIVGPFRIINQSNGQLYVGHENGEGGTFTEAQLLPYIEEFFREKF